MNELVILKKYITLMEHLKKIPLLKIKLKQENIDLKEEYAPKRNISDKEYKKGNVFTTVLTNENEIYQSFIYNKMQFIEPHPVPIYFENARQTLLRLEKIKKEILRNQNAELNKTIDFSLNDIFFFLQDSFTFFTMLTASIECFINTLITNELEFKYEDREGNEIIRKGADISRKVSLRIKVNQLIVFITKKENLSEKYPNSIKTIINLIKKRDKVVHPKRDIEFGNLKMAELYKDCLSFHYKSTLIEVANFINYYSEKELIIECGCGGNH